MREIALEPLTRTAFAPFGEVVELDGVTPMEVNQGFGLRFDNLTRVDVRCDGGDAKVSIFEAQLRPQPIVIKLMERHPLASQMFYPLQPRDWLVVVCGDPHEPSSYRGFRATGRQGVNYARGEWHHPLLVLEAANRFMVVDRKGPGKNLDEVWLEEAKWMRVSG